MKQKKYYEQLSVEVLMLSINDILTVSSGVMTPEGDYDDGTGWFE